MEGLTTHEKAVLKYVLAHAEEMLDEQMLETIAEQEYRLCMLELGIE